MIDLKRLIAEPELFKAVIRRRREKVNIDEVLALDEKRRKKIYELENYKHEKNKLSDYSIC